MKQTQVMTTQSCGFVPDGEFVVSGGYRAVAFDAALDGVALLVDVRIEGWRPAAVPQFRAPASREITSTGVAATSR